MDLGRVNKRTSVIQCLFFFVICGKQQLKVLYLLIMESLNFGIKRRFWYHNRLLVDDFISYIIAELCTNISLPAESLLSWVLMLDLFYLLAC
jgi:hypothetical protein